MKKLIWLLAAVFCLGACGSGSSNSGETSTDGSDSQASEQSEAKKGEGVGNMGKSLIVYYSLTDNTKAVAEEIQKQVGREILRIETVEPYPEVYDEVLDIVRDQREANELPEIMKQEVDLSEYDRIFLGTPICFGEPALPVDKWINENDLSNKSIYPFFTSGSSSINESMSHYGELLDQSTLGEGLGITSSDRSNTSKLVKDWLAEITD